MKGLIVSSGKIESYSLLENLIYENDYTVCADGGLDHLMSIDKIPNLVLGDFDSISNAGINYIKENKIKVEKYPSIKNNTDSELAIMYLINGGIDDITIIGGTGTRLDHTLSNILLLRRFNNNGRSLKIVDDNNIVNYVTDSIDIKRRIGWYVSIIPLNCKGVIVSLLGFRYPLNYKHLEFTSTLGVSNEIIGQVGRIKIHKGEVLVIESTD